MSKKPREYKTDVNGTQLMKCFKCGIFKPLEFFNKNKNLPGGIRTVCRDCRKPEKKIYYKKNKEKYIEQGEKRKEALSKRYGIDRVKFHSKAQSFIKWRGLRPESCSICGERGEIVFHHIDYSSFDNWSIGVFCCCQCHADIHSGKLPDIRPINLLDLKQNVLPPSV